MDGTRFDNLTRKLASGTSRRAVLTGLAGGLAGSVAGLVGSRGAGACTPDRYTCRDDDDCCSGVCVGFVCQAGGTGADCDADLRRDPQHCGACGNACGPNELCANGLCRDCGPWMAPCNGYCYRACPEGQVRDADCGCSPALPLGAACATDTECSSGICDIYYCSCTRDRFGCDLDFPGQCTTEEVCCRENDEPRRACTGESVENEAPGRCHCGTSCAGSIGSCAFTDQVCVDGQCVDPS